MPSLVSVDMSERQDEETDGIISNYSSSSSSSVDRISIALSPSNIHLWFMRGILIDDPYEYALSFLSQHPSPSLVLISSGNWEAAFGALNETLLFAARLQQLTRAAAHVTQQLQPMPVFVHRTANGFCCKTLSIASTRVDRRFTQQRVAYYSSNILAAVLLGAPSAHVIDLRLLTSVEVMEGPVPLPVSYVLHHTCSNGHSKPSQLMMETQVMLNIICGSL